MENINLKFLLELQPYNLDDNLQISLNLIKNNVYGKYLFQVEDDIVHFLSEK